MKPSEAIENIEYARRWMGSESDFSEEALDMAIATLEKQAEDNEWCHDCKEYDKEQHCCHRFTKVIRRAVEDYRRTKHDSTGILRLV